MPDYKVFCRIMEEAWVDNELNHPNQHYKSEIYQKPDKINNHLQMLRNF